MPNILLVDDDPHVLSTFSRALSEEGYSVTEAENGRAGIEALKAASFELVIVDLIMPESDGVQVMEFVQSQFPGIKIIAMTGGGILSADDYLKMAKHLGATFTLSKPCSREDLLVLTREALRKDEPEGS